MRRPASPSESWRAFDANEVTHSGAHYLLAIASIAKEGPPPRAAEVARSLGVSRAAASLQLRSLAGHGFIEIDETQRLHLTRVGADLVARILSKREVVRVFLQDILGVRAHTADADACKIEHLLSEETGAAAVRLIRFLHSDHPAARACLDAFRASAVSCSPGRRCELCVESCLLSGAGLRPGRTRPRPGTPVGWASAAGRRRTRATRPARGGEIPRVAADARRKLKRASKGAA
jgi:DtxR family Mn-dependent transcriptional regulator